MFPVPEREPRKELLIMIILRENRLPFQFNEMATSCHPRSAGGKYPMWIRVEYTNG
jgi:hypothetical protein